MEHQTISEGYIGKCFPVKISIEKKRKSETKVRVYVFVFPLYDRHYWFRKQPVSTISYNVYIETKYVPNSSGNPVVYSVVYYVSEQ